MFFLKAAALDEHFRASNLIGDDQIYCDLCCAKSDFTVVSAHGTFYSRLKSSP